ncbi:MAG: formylmethanofuran dehydrogenase [Deltaproteobacteria bacterium]|nr:formylmethanofuran dehydrogenase [Deltaproteobacteria bacterium]
MGTYYDFPDDFEGCVRFHGHLCPGLAIGYAAVKAGASVLRMSPSPDEELVAVVENDSCAVDAVQVLLGCTFGKGNLIFRDWGKQVFTFIDRATARAVRVSFVGEVPGREERHALRAKIESGRAEESELSQWEELREQVAAQIIRANPADFFTIEEVEFQIPPKASVVGTQPCEVCSEPVVTDRMVKRGIMTICRECAEKP